MINSLFYMEMTAFRTTICWNEIQCSICVHMAVLMKPFSVENKSTWGLMAQSKDWDYSNCLHTVYLSNVISGLRPFFWRGKGLERTIWEDPKEAWQSLICAETWDQKCNLAPVQQQMLIRMSLKGNMRTQNIEMHPRAMLSCICCELTFDCYISSPTGSCYTINFAFKIFQGIIISSTVLHEMHLESEHSASTRKKTKYNDNRHFVDQI